MNMNMNMFMYALDLFGKKHVHRWIPPTPDHTNRQTETLCPNTGRPVHRLHGCRLSETVCLACMSKTACCGVRGSATYSDLLFDVPCCGTLNLFSNCSLLPSRAPASAIRQLAHHLEHLDHPHGYVFLKTSLLSGRGHRGVALSPRSLSLTALLRTARQLVDDRLALRVILLC